MSGRVMLNRRNREIGYFMEYTLNYPKKFSVEQLYPTSKVEEFYGRVQTGEVTVVNIDSDELRHSEFDGSNVLVDSRKLFGVNDFVVTSENGYAFVTSYPGVWGGYFSVITDMRMFLPTTGVPENS